jgi:hypothetical protein
LKKRIKEKKALRSFGIKVRPRLTKREHRYIDSLHLEEENQRKESITLIWYKGPPTFAQT